MLITLETPQMAGNVSLTEAADQLRITRTRLRTLAKRLGIAMQRIVVGLSPDDIARIRRELDTEDDRITMKVACNRLHMSYNTLRRRMELLGIVPEARGYAKLLTPRQFELIAEDDRQEIRYRRMSRARR